MKLIPKEEYDFVTPTSKRIYQAIYAIENALDDLRGLPIEELRTYEMEIAAAALSFGCLLNAFRKDTK